MYNVLLFSITESIMDDLISEIVTKLKDAITNTCKKIIKGK